jgi:hypothetical protein
VRFLPAESVGGFSEGWQLGRAHVDHAAFVL